MDDQHDDQQHDQHEPDEDVQQDVDPDEAYDDQPDEAYDEAYDPAEQDDWVADLGGSRGPDPDAEDWEARDGITGVGPLVAAGLVGVVSALVLVLAWTALGPDDAADTRDTGVDASTVGRVDAAVPSPSTGGERGRQTRLARCVRAQESLQGPLDAARPALDQWAVHVGAMNKLVVGEITLQQATDFWESTRLGAQRRVRDFGASLGALRDEGVDCPQPDLLAPGARALPGCAREVQAEVRALRAARVSISTWEEHIHHMDMLRLGQMTPEQATEMWLDSWQRGVRDLDSYKAARKAAQREDGCSQAGS